MKQFISLLIFIFISSFSFGQSDSLLCGAYTHVEERGVHSVPGESFGDLHVTSYVSHVDTTITHSLQLDINHNAVLQIDTTINFWVGFKSERKWLGKWEIIKDTLYITFTEISTLWPPVIEAKPNPTIEKMTTPITFVCTLSIYDHRIYGLGLIKEETVIMYTKE